MENQEKKMLITSGGTIVRIDDVRHIGNFSQGTFPSHLAEAALDQGYKVFYLHARGAKLPDTSAPNLNRDNLTLVQYLTVDDYAARMEEILRNQKIDVFLSGAAVSDYGVEPVKGKISSNEEELIIKLVKLPKYIQFAKKWSKTPLFQTGFKLLSNVSDEELIEVGYKSGLENRSDITIANDLAKIRQGNREVILITPERGAIKFSGPELSDSVISFIKRRSNVTHFRTEVSKDPEFLKQFNPEIRSLAATCRELVDLNMMPAFYRGSSAYHGSIAKRITGNEFLITARGSNKTDLGLKDITLVRDIDWEKRVIKVTSESDARPSFNAALARKVFETFPDISILLHTHTFAKDVPETSFPETPGTLEYVNKAMELLRNNRLVNLSNHGLVCLGQNLEEAKQYVYRNS